MKPQSGFSNCKTRVVSHSGAHLEEDFSQTSDKRQLMSHQVLLFKE